jgi:hypothetical protein
VLEALEQARAAVYLACFHFQRILDLGPACEEVSVGQAGQLAWAGCSERMCQGEEGLGNLGQEEGRKEACHNQAVGVRIRNRGRRLEHLGNHEVHQVPGSEPVAGTAAAAGLVGNRKEGREAAAGQADRGIEEAAGSEAADGAAAAVAAETGGLTAIIVSLCSVLVHCSHRCNESETRSWTAACLPLCSAMATYPTQAPSTSQAKLFQTAGRE